MHPTLARTSDSPSEAAEPPDFVRELTRELLAGDVRLPSFPDLIVRLQQILQDPRAAPAQIARVISADAALAARILRLANSAFLNPGSKPITDLGQAVTRIGHQLVRCTAVAFALRQMKFGGRTAEVRPQLQALWRVGVLVASIAYVIARETRAAGPEEAMLTGLMHNIGRLYITVHAPAGTFHGGRTDVPVQLVNEWHPRVARAILKQWKFPATILAAVADQDLPDRGLDDAVGLTEVLAAAVALVPCVFRRDQLDETVASVSAFQRLGLTAAAAQSVLAASAQPVRALQSALSG